VEVIESDEIMDAMRSAPDSPSHLDNRTAATESELWRATMAVSKMYHMADELCGDTYAHP
jgi:hypothetical protein